MLSIRSLQFSTLDVPLLAPFGIATGAQHIARNVLLSLGTDRGITGFGEGAPVEHISGETREAVFEALQEVSTHLEGVNITSYRPVCLELREALKHVPSALQAVEIALFDALTKHYGTSLLDWFGGATSQLLTDITVTTGTAEQSRSSASRYFRQGFSVLKVKIGGSSLDQDVERLEAIFEAAPHAQIVLDGNTAFTAQEATQLIDSLGSRRVRIALFEQPVERDDFEGLREVEKKTGIRVAADESLRSEADFQKLLLVGGISAVNIKTAKLGVLQAWDLLVAARRAGLAVMIGGMVETELSMTASACLAAGVGGVEFVDLDTPLLLGPRPLTGGFIQQGPHLDLSRIVAGHGVTPL